MSANLIEENGTITGIRWKGGKGYAIFAGTFASATINLQFCPVSFDSDDSDHWLTINDGAVDGAEIIPIDLPRGEFRLVVTNATASTEVVYSVGFGL